ncbi:hypothetical protein [Dapis sp. BLCC M229]|uniref:hypothetical protein n=1 Tax=Dapis sp. BLCC M229 TaxID=3400188 RepID=UPI003CFA1C40
MEPITILTALAAVLGTKALEKTGENIGQVVWDKSAKLMKYLKQESPGAIAAIEQASEQPLDYGQAVLEMQEAAENPDVAQTIQELAAAVEENSHPKLTEVVAEIREALKSHKLKNGWWCIVMVKEATGVLGDGEMGRWGDGEIGR